MLIMIMKILFDNLHNLEQCVNMLISLRFQIPVISTGIQKTQNENYCLILCNAVFPARLEKFIFQKYEYCQAFSRVLLIKGKCL
jgi:regulator of replication initiation timing